MACLLLGRLGVSTAAAALGRFIRTDENDRIREGAEGNLMVHQGNWSSHVWGELDCRCFDNLPPNAEPKQLAVLCHGFGAPGNDLDGLGPAVLQMAPQLAETTRFVFPSAPLSLDHLGMFGGRAWWPLDVEQLASAVERGEIRNLRNEQPPELPDAREKLMAVVASAQAHSGVTTGQTVLGGFSQGAMIATDVALHMDETPAGLCVFSGSLLNESEWRRLAEQSEGLRVVQSHGRDDPILPFQAAHWLRDLLTEFGAKVDFIEFSGGHTIPEVALRHYAELLSASPAT